MSDSLEVEQGQSELLAPPELIDEGAVPLFPIVTELLKSERSAR